MTIIILVFIIFTLLTSRPVKNNENYLSKDYTNIIKGFFLFFVFIRHFIQYIPSFNNTWIDTFGLAIDNKLSQLIVVMFLFYSGYGIMESAKNKGKKYITEMPKKRILSTWINFAIAVIIFIIATNYFSTHEFSVKKIILSLIGWDSVGNSNWYIFCIIILYFISFLSLKAFNDNKRILCSIFIGTLLYTFLMDFYKYSYFYNTAFCYVLGVAFSMYKEKIEGWLKGRELISFAYLVASFIIAYKLRKHIFWYHIHTLIFTLIIVLLTRKIKIKNAILAWFGKNLFPLYIFQRLPMILLNRLDYMHNNPYLFFLSSFVITIVIAILYNIIIAIVKKIRTKLTNKKNLISS